MLLNVITYLVLRDSMIRKHYEKIMNKREKRSQKVADMLERLDWEDQQYNNLYMDNNGNIDWQKLAQHVKEATSGR
jgi:phosphopantetheine adenylyltransferase